MFVYKNFSPRGMWNFVGFHAVWIAVYASLVTVIYEYTAIEWLVIPWLPLSLIGTAVAFYIGFKNNQAYDRLWEARKIWGAIVNSSRAWGSMSRAFVNNDHAEDKMTDETLNKIHHRLIKRHIAWLYTLRRQLLLPTQWEHISQNWFVRKLTEKRMQTVGKGIVSEQDETALLYLGEAGLEKLAELDAYSNAATQIIDRQSLDLASLKQRGLIDDFRHMELQKTLNEFYVEQGKCERIKKFPLPRQYATTSFLFVILFILLLPLGMVSAFSELGDWGPWLSVIFTTIVGWVFMTMELVGDYSENPFEGLGNDIPMFSLCRTIEIDLLEMLGVEDIPKPIKPEKGVLM